MKIIKRLGIAVLAVFTISSCSDNFFDVNTDQNNPTYSTPELTLPVAQKFTVDILEGNYNSMNTLGNLWSYSWAAAGDYAYFEEETKYQITSGFRTQNFEIAYLRPLTNYNYVESFTDPKYDNYRAIAKIMKAFHFQYLVDAYGDIPYTEAFQRGNNPTPAYDDAQFIYDDLIVQLTAAQALIANADANALVVGSHDVMCGGDMAKWAKFANSLKLRILLRQSSKAGNTITATTLTSNIDASVGFLGAGETVFCNPGYLSLVSLKQNPFYDAFKLDASGIASSNAGATRATPWVLGLMDDTDPRKPLMWTKVGGNYVGIDQNGIGGLSGTALSAIGAGILKGPTMSAIIMSSAESLFLQAEAAARFGVFGSAETLYNQAMQENFTQLGAGSAAPFVTNSAFLSLPGDPALQFEAIITQKFLSLVSTNGYENWIEYRRTGFPSTMPTAPTFTVKPVRLLYPTSEYSSNADNVPAQVATDAFTAKVFWDN
jgi:hypothetical protein